MEKICLLEYFQDQVSGENPVLCKINIVIMQEIVVKKKSFIHVFMHKLMTFPFTTYGQQPIVYL